MMFNMNNSSFGRNRNGMFGSSRYQYQTVAPNYVGTQSSGLISKVMGLLAVSFLFALLGTFIGGFLNIGIGTYFVIVIAGFIVLIALQFAIQKPGLNLFLLYLFTFLEGMALSPIIGI